MLYLPFLSLLSIHTCNIALIIQIFYFQKLHNHIIFSNRIPLQLCTQPNLCIPSHPYNLKCFLPQPFHFKSAWGINFQHLPPLLSSLITLGRVAKWDSKLTLNLNQTVSGSNPTAAFLWALKPNLTIRLPMISGSN